LEVLRQRITTLLRQQTWGSIDEAIRILTEETRLDGTLDPFRNPDGLLWNDLALTLKANGLLSEALTVFHAFLDRCYELQEEHSRRIHKGTPLQYLGLTYQALGQSEQARKYHILAFIEDVINARENPPNTIVCSPASIVLRRTYRMRETELQSIQDYVLGRPLIEILLYPEDLLLNWMAENERNEQILIARSKEERLYKTNLFHLRRLINLASTDVSGEAMEFLAYYLFSCVDGFEPVPRRGTSAFHFDLVVRNLTCDHPLVAGLGEYIGVECKNLNKTVSAQQINHFIQKLRLHNMKCGVIFTKNGISGVKFRGLVFGRLIQAKTWNRDGIVVFDLTSADLAGLGNGDNLVSLLLKKYEAIRFL